MREQVRRRGRVRRRSDFGSVLELHLVFLTQFGSHPSSPSITHARSAYEDEMMKICDAGVLWYSMITELNGELDCKAIMINAQRQ